MAAREIEHLIGLLAKLPGLGPRSARRLALHLIRSRAQLLDPLATALAQAGKALGPCRECGNIDAVDPCAICADPERDRGLICVVEEVADLWAMERSGAYQGRYHVLGGALSALDGKGPEDLKIAELTARAGDGVREVILATNATVAGQTTAHYIMER
ncbi:MAG: recombination mediator RecR, partial [Alphaproteobacteria bacterium]|nr:recombination mediator RecR [Alphaproteobacteria bacterium]